MAREAGQTEVALVAGCFQVTSADTGTDYFGFTPADIEKIAAKSSDPDVHQLCDMIVEAHARAADAHADVLEHLGSRARSAHQVSGGGGGGNGDVGGGGDGGAAAPALSLSKSPSPSPPPLPSLSSPPPLSPTPPPARRVDCFWQSSSRADDAVAWPAANLLTAQTEVDSLARDKVILDLIEAFQSIVENLNKNLRWMIDERSQFYVRIAGFGPVPAFGMLTCAKNGGALNKLFNLTRAANVQKYDFPASPPEEKVHVSELRGHAPVLTLFRQGCGDCTLLCLPYDGKWVQILIDGGYWYSPKVWWPHVESLSELDLVLVTHTDGDHIGGIASLAKSYNKLSTAADTDTARLTIKHVVMTAATRTHETALLPSRTYNQWKVVHDIFKTAGLLRGAAVAGQTTSWGENVKLFVVSPSGKVHDFERARQEATMRGTKFPTDPAMTSVLKWPNPASIVTLVLWRPLASGGWTSMLFTGDAPSEYIVDGLKDLAKDHQEVRSLKVTRPNGTAWFRLTFMDIPHHGSSNNDPELLFDNVLAQNYGYSYNGKSHAKKMCDGETLKYLIEAHKSAGILANVYCTFEMFKAGSAAHKDYDPKYVKDDPTSGVRVVGNVTIHSLGHNPDNGKLYPAWRVEL
jgi:hypothetical protein